MTYLFPRHRALAAGEDGRALLEEGADARPVVGALQGPGDHRLDLVPPVIAPQMLRLTPPSTNQRLCPGLVKALAHATSDATPRHNSNGTASTGRWLITAPVYELLIRARAVGWLAALQCPHPLCMCGLCGPALAAVSEAAAAMAAPAGAASVVILQVSSLPLAFS